MSLLTPQVLIFHYLFIVFTRLMSLLTQKQVLRHHYWFTCVH